MSHIKNSGSRHFATPQDVQKEYAFEMAASSIRFGPGVTKEVGMDFKNMGARRVCVVTDATVDKLDAMKQVREGLTREGIPFDVYTNVRVEPKDSSWVESADVPHWRSSTNYDLGSRRLLSGLDPVNQMPFWLSAEVPSWTRLS
jgi:hydroxyacid-oxoacid transhydrogenase